MPVSAAYEPAAPSRRHMVRNERARRRPVVADEGGKAFVHLSSNPEVESVAFATLHLALAECDEGREHNAY